MRSCCETDKSMRLRAVTEPEQVTDCYHAFLKCIINYPGVEQVENCRVGHQGRCFKDAKVYWSRELGVWLYPRETRNRSVNAYWNAFGCQDPYETHNLNIVVEINFSFDGSYRRTSGVFLRDDKGDLLVGHRGLIRSGKKRFWNEYTGERVWISDEGKDAEIVAVVGRICQDFPVQVARFIKEVERIKNA
ncbi:MAG: hypothetical protein H5T95_13975 [Firmicutes bacterium]|nr:hypothetical protein [Bacillota bacterium]